MPEEKRGKSAQEVAEEVAEENFKAETAETARGILARMDKMKEIFNIKQMVKDFQEKLDRFADNIKEIK